jgi:hypothetical protein
MTCQQFNEEREELSFMGMKLSWHSYQLSMSHRIKCLWNYGVKLSIESGCFIRVSFHSIWHGSLENNEMKLSTETGLIRKLVKSNERGVRSNSKKLITTLIKRHAQQLHSLPQATPRLGSLQQRRQSWPTAEQHAGDTHIGSSLCTSEFRITATWIHLP